jgi:hypothetical protein
MTRRDWESNLYATTTDGCQHLRIFTHSRRQNVIKFFTSSILHSTEIIDGSHKVRIEEAIKVKESSYQQIEEKETVSTNQKQKLLAEIENINSKIQKIHAHTYFIQATLDSYIKAQYALQKKMNLLDLKKIKKLLTESKKENDEVQLFQVFISIIKGSWFEGDVIVKQLLENCLFKWFLSRIRDI